ncbi:XdhC/CoxI family protein [Actinacidiphila sp. ITFR-21]|uniref:XdhC/CoxI family protein n=1 Tax=Actinacidiphila sp. ITFR-21 TaxID=3075199 RepID=UPI00288976AA|nr:XdhC/CoxI family protein [Streptomyces sp. ITFR-21]WNI17838.1 XdhC family protein [Streptomyces sp. ITFR-21]
MLDIASQLAGIHATGRPYAVATVIRVAGSAPRDPGAALAVDTDGEALGSVSGGCVEGAVYELCQEAISSGRPVVEQFGYSDEDAFAVGLSCGGTLDVLVQPVRPGQDPGWDEGLSLMSAGRPVALARVVSGPAALLGSVLAVTAGTHTGTLPAPAGPGAVPGALERAVVAETRALLELGRTGTVTFAPDGRPCPPEGPAAIGVFVESYAPPPRMLVFGAIDFAAAVTRIGRFLGYRVTVCDARPVFATARRFPDADEVVVDWPHRYLESQAADLDSRTVVCVLTHDAKFDVPLLERALRTVPGYVGAMGSRRTHHDRLARLREIGLSTAELARLRSPIGLDLGARTPEETAVAVAAEIIAFRRGGSGLPLSAGGGPIHHDLGPVARPLRPAAAAGARTLRIPAVVPGLPAERIAG